METEESLGLGLAPGDAHYRAFVGPPGDYDLVAAMTFGLLTTLGLRQHHALLDIGCGSLRIGRLLIPYLNRGGYTGLEPNEWLVRDGIAQEVGEDLIRIKTPHFEYSASASGLVDHGRHFQYAVAQSIFSHTGLDLLDRWLGEVAALLGEDGVLLATYLPADSDSEAKGWIYPGCVRFRPSTMGELAARHGLDFVPLDWKHPRQSWAAFAKPGFDADWYRDRALSWSACFDRVNREQDRAARRGGS